MAPDELTYYIKADADENEPDTRHVTSLIDRAAIEFWSKL
jgi:hypothetical protein